MISGGSPGQAIILIAVAFVVLLGFVGLVTDAGQLFIFMGHLRRATDAASLAAAAQYREGRTISEMTAAASQVMSLNGIDPAHFTLLVETCDTNPSDSQLCTTPRRKLVRVTGHLAVPMTFLSLLGVKDITISANSIGEAASLDVVLVIDISESMAWDSPVGNPYRDPSYCNAADPGASDGFRGDCQPFQEVKRAAISFANRILNKAPGLEEDRLAIVTFANGWSPNADQGTYVRTSGWTNNAATAVTIVQGLNIYEPPTCYNPRNYDPNTDTPPGGTINQFYGPCRYYYPDDSYAYLDCFSCLANMWPDPKPANNDWSALPTTNIGGGLLRAGNMFALNMRPEALWVVVLLTDGMANATDLDSSRAQDITNYNTYPLGFCPNPSDTTFPLCQDKDVSTRHRSGDFSYDADDYARDMADFVGCYPTNTAAACGSMVGQGAVIFAIGLGNGVLDSSNEINGKPYGASLLRYIARVGYAGDPDPSRDPCRFASSYQDWCGNYYYAPQGPQLSRIFEDIASRIFTRLTH